MPDILSIVAVAGPFVGAGLGILLSKPLENNIIKRHHRTIDDLRRDRDSWRSTATFMSRQHNASVRKNLDLTATIADLRKQLTLAGKPDQPRDALGRFLPFPANDGQDAAA